MCFVPIVSLTTAIIEFILATVLLLFFPKTMLRNFFAVFIYWLAAYQLSEFFVCTTGYSIFWATIGIVLYSFLPAMGLHGILRIFNRKVNLFLIYIIPVIVAIVAVVVIEFVSGAQCFSFFIIVKSILFQRDSLFSMIKFFIYTVVYYFGFIMAMGWIIIADYLKEKNIIRKKIDMIMFFGILLLTVPVLFFIIIFPSFKIMFPSVLCEFAIFVAICAFVVVYLEAKLKGEFSKS